MTSVSKDPSYDISNEESGWTTYFEDFFNNNNNIIDDNNQHKSSLSLSRVASSSSLLSDATSLVEKNVAHIVEDEEEVSLNKYGKESSSFKKRKKITDDALEDTATSPLNSPKVLYANHQFDRPKEHTEVGTFSQEKGNTSGQKELSFIGRNSDSTELKERGLCVVPMSMVVANHIV